MLGLTLIRDYSCPRESIVCLYGRKNVRADFTGLTPEKLITGIHLVFWDAKGVNWIYFFTSGTINAVRYCDTLTKLKSAIQRKTPGLLSRAILFLDDNARPNTARVTKEDIRHLGWERWVDPVFSPDLAPSDLELFLHRNKHSRDVTSETMKRCGAVKSIIRSLGTCFPQDGFLKLFYGMRHLSMSVANMWGISQKFVLFMTFYVSLYNKASF
ncbi:hypothetical protein AVEN_130209-1 [Araneus ventricosus]|uniref:Tc1-like transposase DDE domain-containing protein n=1 Tax=Araneus ventricosus TaxID=182803 RepID=A0A4Y2TWY1_ARAVE|nr:hypothetical protein AVEN_130209-1 [Araneus ventricosus]